MAISPSGIQVIARAAAILRTLSDDPSGQSLGQIAQTLNLPRSTVQRIVRALAAEHLVSTTHGIRLGPALQSLAKATRIDMTDQCRPHLGALAKQTGETVDLSVLRGGQMIFLDQTEGTGRLRTVSAVGEAFPLTTTANGRACLAALPDQHMLQLATAEWAARRETVDLPGFLALIAEVRKTGLARDLDAHTTGISALGISFTDGTDHYAISVPIPSSRFAEKSGIVTKALLELRSRLQIP
jgi:DNA-binding IclR family transcriptional regulator